MLKKDRQRYISQKLSLNGTITVKEIAVELGCSEETIRRELKEMEAQGSLNRVHGGAYIDTYQNQIPIQRRREFMVNEKTKIAELVIGKYVDNKMTIMLDDSTTSLTLAKEIVARDMELAIITNSLMIMGLFEKSLKNTKLIAIGGNYRESSASFVGYEAIENVKNYYSDVLFFSPPSMGMKSGIMHNVSSQAGISKIMVQRSKKRVLLMDHSKFKDYVRFLISDFSDIDAVVSDAKPKDEWIEFFKEKNIELVY